jgi:hypothetical protein
MQQVIQKVEVLLVPGKIKPVDMPQIFIDLVCGMVPQQCNDRIARSKIAHDEGNKAHTYQHENQPYSASDEKANHTESLQRL